MEPINADISQKRQLFQKDISNLFLFKERIENIFSTEFIDVFPDILKIPQLDFINYVITGVKNSLSDLYDIDQIFQNEKFINIFSTCTKNIENKYTKYLNILNDSLEFYEKKYRELENSYSENVDFSEYHFSNFRKHCCHTGKVALHKCSETYSYGEYLISCDTSKKTNNIKFLICSKCHKTYFTNLFKNFCEECNITYYSSILDNKNEGPEYFLATLNPPHCPVLVNKKLKCIKCKTNYLYINIKNNKLRCLNNKCNFICDPEDIEHTCEVCSIKYKTNIRLYNPLETKHLEDAKKLTLLTKKKAHPIHVLCCNNINVFNTIFYHNKICRGILYLGELNKNIIIVCQKCKAINFFNRFIWTCPFCGKKLRDPRVGNNERKIKFLINSRENKNHVEKKKIEHKGSKSLLSDIMKKRECVKTARDRKENNLDHLISINKIIYNNYNTNCLNDIKNLNEYIIYKKKAYKEEKNLNENNPKCNNEGENSDFILDTKNKKNYLVSKYLGKQINVKLIDPKNSKNYNTSGRLDTLPNICKEINLFDENMDKKSPNKKIFKNSTSENSIYSPKKNLLVYYKNCLKNNQKNVSLTENISETIPEEPMTSASNRSNNKEKEKEKKYKKLEIVSEDNNICNKIIRNQKYRNRIRKINIITDVNIENSEKNIINLNSINNSRTKMYKNNNDDNIKEIKIKRDENVRRSPLPRYLYFRKKQSGFFNTDDKKEENNNNIIKKIEISKEDETNIGKSKNIRENSKLKRFYRGRNNYNKNQKDNDDKKYMKTDLEDINNSKKAISQIYEKKVDIKNEINDIKENKNKNNKDYNNKENKNDNNKNDNNKNDNNKNENNRNEINNKENNRNEINNKENKNDSNKENKNNNNEIPIKKERRYRRYRKSGAEKEKENENENEKQEINNDRKRLEKSGSINNNKNKNDEDNKSNLDKSTDNNSNGNTNYYYHRRKYYQSSKLANIADNSLNDLENINSKSSQKNIDSSIKKIKENLKNNLNNNKNNIVQPKKINFNENDHDYIEIENLKIDNIKQEILKKELEEKKYKQDLLNDINNAIIEQKLRRPDDVISIKSDTEENLDIPILSEDINNNKNLFYKIKKKIKEILSKGKLPHFDVQNYQIQKQIGDGSFGVIYEVINKNTSIRYAMKKIVAPDLESLEIFQKEFEMVHMSPHPYILDLHGICVRCIDETNYILYVLMDLAEADWDVEINEHLICHNYYSEKKLISILKQITSALAYLQRDKHIAHRDIKPENVLIFMGDIYKISDFGEAKETKINKQLNTLRGTELYMSPLLYQGLQDEKDDVQHNPYKSDVFSLGYCFIYAAALNFDIIYEIRNEKNVGNLRKILCKHFGKRYSSKFIELILSMIEYDENKRMDFIQLEKILKDF